MKYKVGDRVRIVGNLGGYSVGDITRILQIQSDGMYVIGHDYPRSTFMTDDMFSLFTRFKLHSEYNSENGTKWTCVHIRDDGSAILDTGHLAGEFNPDGTYKYGHPDGDDFDICFDYLNTDTSVGGVYILPLANTEHPYMIHFNVIDGKPDWENAKVTGV